jgi:signal peptidase I
MIPKNEKQIKVNTVLGSLLDEGHVIDVPVFGLSMFPSLLPGSVVRVAGVNPEHLQPGDVVFFERNGQLVLHRFIKRIGSTIHCKGDSLLQRDEPVDFVNVKGKLIAMVVNGQQRPVDRPIAKVYARLMVILVPVSGYLFFHLSHLWYKFCGKGA